MSHLTRGLTSFPSSHSSLRLSWDTIVSQYIKTRLLLRFPYPRFHFTSLHLILPERHLHHHRCPEKLHETLLNSHRFTLHRCEEAPNEDEVEIRIPPGVHPPGGTRPTHRLLLRHVPGPHLAVRPCSVAAATLL
jgi:hypothetical protein